MKLKIWPLLALVLLGLSLVIRKVHIAKTDFNNANVSVEKTTTAPSTADVAQLYLTDPAPQVAEPLDQAERSTGSPGTLQFGAGANTKIPLARSQLSPGDDELTTDTPEDTGQSGGAWAFLWANLATIVWALIALIEVIVRLTPSEKDNSILSYITDLLSKIIPNRRVGGGTL